MTTSTIDAAVRSLVTLAATAGGVWVVIRLAVRYQVDIADRYAIRVDALEARLAAAELEVVRCEARTDRLIAAMRRAGIDVPAEVWDP